MDTHPVTACQQKKIEVYLKDLPLCCPTPQMQLWNGHPRVFLPIEESGHETCPYCGTEFILVDHEAHQKD